MRTNKNQEKNQDNAWFGQTYKSLLFSEKKKEQKIKKSQFQNIITAFKSELQQMQTNICQMKTCNPD